MHRRGREAVELAVIGRVHRDELALQMRRQLGDLDAGVRADALDLVAIGLRARRLLQVEQPSVPGRDLHALVAEPGGPFGDRLQRVERRGVARELRQEYCGSLHRLRHEILPRPDLLAVSNRFASLVAKCPASLRRPSPRTMAGGATRTAGHQPSPWTPTALSTIESAFHVYPPILVLPNFNLVA